VGGLLFHRLLDYAVSVAGVAGALRDEDGPGASRPAALPVAAQDGAGAAHRETPK
jgi:hypothetical protein